ncbi:MAG: hypothetical protein ACI865_002064 [Flavobacteriaceae bacterium]|jgi:hypothetical protein
MTNITLTTAIFCCNEGLGTIIVSLLKKQSMKTFLTSLLIISSLSSCAQLSKKQVTENIDNWYLEHSDYYAVELTGKDAVATITRYHPERPEEKNDLIAIDYRGMHIEMKFAKPIAEISTHKDSLQRYLTYVSLHNIYTEIADKGWPVYPRSPQSSLDATGVKFTKGGESISLTINWSTYTVMGYKDSKKCNNELGIADGSVSEECYVAIDKRLPLEVTVTDVIVGGK